MRRRRQRESPLTRGTTGACASRRGRPSTPSTTPTGSCGRSSAAARTGRRSPSSRRWTRSPSDCRPSSQRDGARSVSVWKGEAIGFAQQEDLARRFIHAIGSPNYLSNDSMCWVGRFTGYKLVLGAWPNVDIENARCVVMWGANPPHSRPNLTQRITAARRRGATLVAVDPRLSAVARRADLHVAPLPGTDGAFALGLIRELVESGSYDRCLRRARDRRLRRPRRLRP